MIWRGDKNLIGGEHPLPFWDLTLIQSALFLLLFLFFPPHTSSGERGRSPDSTPENLIIGLTLKIKSSFFFFFLSFFFFYLIIKVNEKASLIY